MAHPLPPEQDPDAERTEVLDVREFAPPTEPPAERTLAFEPAPAPDPLPTRGAEPVGATWAAPRPTPAPDVARVDHRDTVEWALVEARANNRPLTDVGLLLLRVCSLPLVLRGLHKLVDFPGFVDTLRDNAFAAQAPELLGVLVVGGEIALPVLIAIGLATRVAGLLQATLMIGIFVFWTLAGAPLLDPVTGGLSGEPELLFAALALPLVFTGGGRAAIDRALTAAGRERRIARRVAKRLGE